MGRSLADYAIASILRHSNSTNPGDAQTVINEGHSK